LLNIQFSKGNFWYIAGNLLFYGIAKLPLVLIPSAKFTENSNFQQFLQQLNTALKNDQISVVKVA